MKRLVFLLVLLIFLCACTQNVQNGTDTSDVQSQDNETTVKEEDTLLINGVYYVDKQTAVIGGMCSKNTVFAVCGENKYSAQARNGVFFVSVTAEENKNTEYLISCGNASAKVTVGGTCNKEFVDFYAGENSQLFLKSHIEDYTGESALDENALRYLVKILKQRNEYVKSHNSKLIIAVVPNPQTLYEEYAPKHLKKGSVSLRTQLGNALKSADITYIDLTDVLVQAKNKGYPLVYQTDTHWTEYASFAAYCELHKIIKADFPHIQTHTEDDFKIESVSCIAGNFIPDGKEAYAEAAYFLTPNFTNENPLYEKVKPYALQGAHIRTAYTVKTENTEYPDCLFVRDSFSTGIMKFLCDDFSSVYMQPMWQHSIDEEAFEAHTPDYVIHLLSEANIEEILK